MSNDSVSIPSISSGGGSSDTDSNISSIYGGSLTFNTPVPLSEQNKDKLGVHGALALSSAGNANNQQDALIGIFISKCISKVDSMCQCLGLKGCKEEEVLNGGGNQLQGGGYNLEKILLLQGLTNRSGNGVALGNQNGTNLLSNMALLNAISGDDKDKDTSSTFANLMVLNGINGQKGVAHGNPGGLGGLLGMGGNTDLLLSILKLDSGLKQLQGVVCDEAMTDFIKYDPKNLPAQALAQGQDFVDTAVKLHQLLKVNNPKGGGRRGRRPACKNSKKKSSCNRRKNCSWSKSHKRKGSRKRVSGSCRKISKGRGRGRGRGRK